MALKSFSRIEPVSNPKDPARAIAAFMAFVGIVGAIPGAYGTLVWGFVTFASIAEGRAFGFAGISLLAFFLLGFRQLYFYWQRAIGRDVRNARGWWVSTYVYNLVLMVASVAAFCAGPHVASGIAVAWFASLALLALVAHGSER